MDLDRATVGNVGPFSLGVNIPGLFIFKNLGLIGKIAFLFLVLILFIIFVRLGVELIYYLMGPSPNPVIVDGMRDANEQLIVSTNPNIDGSIPILRSQNERDGLVFTWSVWMWIDDSSVSSDGLGSKWKPVFSRGYGGQANQSLPSENLTNVLSPTVNAPGLYIAPTTKHTSSTNYVNSGDVNLVVVMNTFDKIDEQVTITDVPINNWVNVIIRLDQHQLDVFINGSLTKRHILSGVPRQSYGDIYVTNNGGFNGHISQLQYFSSALGTSQIVSIAEKGPNLATVDSNLNKYKPFYISSRWYFRGPEDGYNPGNF